MEEPQHKKRTPPETGGGCLGFVEDLTLNHANQIMAFILIQNDHHISTKAENGDDAARQEEHNPAFHGEDHPNQDADSDEHQTGKNGMQNLRIEGMPF